MGSQKISNNITVTVLAGLVKRRTATDVAGQLLPTNLHPGKILNNIKVTIAAGQVKRCISIAVPGCQIRAILQRPLHPNQIPIPSRVEQFRDRNRSRQHPVLATLLLEVVVLAARLLVVVEARILHDGTKWHQRLEHPRPKRSMTRGTSGVPSVSDGPSRTDNQTHRSVSDMTATVCVLLPPITLDLLHRIQPSGMWVLEQPTWWWT